MVVTARRGEQGLDRRLEERPCPNAEHHPGAVALSSSRVDRAHGEVVEQLDELGYHPVHVHRTDVTLIRS
jgi:hypothetical protein